MNNIKIIQSVKHNIEEIERLTEYNTWLATKHEVSLKVDKVDGKGLSANDYTDDDKETLASLRESGGVNSINKNIAYLFRDINDLNFELKMNDVIANKDLKTVFVDKIESESSVQVIVGVFKDGKLCFVETN